MSRILGPANVLSEEDIQKLLSVFSAAPTSKRNRALVVLLWRTGLRCSEALDLERSDLKLDVEEPYLRVREGKTKTAARTVGIHPDAVAELERWFVVSPASRYVFCTLRGERLDSGYIREMLSRKGKQAGVARVHPHALRATLAVELVSEGTPLPAVRDVLGHANIAHTDAYLRRVFPQAAISAVIRRPSMALT